MKVEIPRIKMGEVGCKRLCLDKKHAIKNPLVIQEIIELAKKKEKSSTTLEKIISQILTKREIELQ